MRTLLPPIAVSFALLTSCSEQSPQKIAISGLDQQLAAILETLPGTYVAEAPRPVPPTGEMKTLVHKFAPINAPQFGDTVLYYQMSTGSGDGQALQMKIFSFDTDPDRTTNSMNAHVFAAGQAEGNLEQEPERWTALDPSALSSFPTECDLIWTGVEGGHIGQVRAEDCAFQGTVFKGTIRPEMSYRITGDRLEWAEVLYTGDMAVLVTTDGPLGAVRQ